MCVFYFMVLFFLGYKLKDNSCIEENYLMKKNKKAYS